MKTGILILFSLTVASGQSPGTFTATGNPTAIGLFPRATLLFNGQVLITGGAAELYDPSNGKFTSIGNTPLWASHSSTLLADGRVLLASGGSDSAHAELYDPSTGTADKSSINAETIPAVPGNIISHIRDAGSVAGQRLGN